MEFKSCHGHQLAKKLYAGRKSVGHPSKAICCFDGPPITSATGSSHSRLRDSFLCTAVSKCAQPFGSAHGRFEVHMAICFLTSFTAINLPHARCQLSIPHTPVVNSTRPLSIPHTCCQFNTLRASHFSFGLACFFFRSPECSLLSIPHARCQFHTPVVNSTRPLSISHTRCQFHTRRVAISDHLIGPHHQFYALAFFIAHMHKKRKKGFSCFGTQGPGFNFYTPVVELTPVFF